MFVYKAILLPLSPVLGVFINSSCGLIKWWNDSRKTMERLENDSDYICRGSTVYGEGKVN